MQVNTLTITTERMEANGDLFKITSFEQKTTAFCDCCCTNETATKDELKRKGWGFTNGAEFCPDCNY